MERKRSSSSEEGSSDLRKCRKKFTEVESILKYDVDKYFDEPLSDEYQPQFFNYQLIGDSVAVGILNSKDLIIKQMYYMPLEPYTRQRFCDEAWSVQDLLLEMKSKKSIYPIAKKVILSVGYNDYRLNLMNPDMFVECLEKIIKKLHRRGCKEIIMTNIPPCGMECDSINHWKYLQIINEETFKLSEKHDYISHCDIFKLFCRPKNLFSQNKDYVSGTEINYKVDFTMYNEVGFDGEIDLINFSNLAKIVLGKHVAKTVEKRVEYLRYGQVDKVICVLKEVSDVDDSDSEEEAVVIVQTNDADKCDAVINLDSSDEDEAGGNRQDDSDTKNVIPLENVPLQQEISTDINKPEDINEERRSCEMPPEDQRMEQVISSSIKSVDIENENTSCEMPSEDQRMKQVISSSIKSVDIKNEKTSCEMPPEDQRMKQVLSSSIKSVEDIKTEKTSSEMPPKEERMKQVLSSSMKSVDIKSEKTSSEMPLEEERMKQVLSSSMKRVDIKSEKTSSEMPLEEERMKQIISSIIKSVGDVHGEEPSCQMLNQVISCSIRSVEDTKDEKPSCAIPHRNEKMKQEIVNDIEESERVRREIVRKIEISERIKQDIVSKIERSEPTKQELVSNTEKSEPVKQEIVSSVEKSEPVKQDIVSNIERSNDIKGEKRLCEISKEDGRFKQVIFCNFKKLGPEIGQPSCQIPQKDSQSKPVISSSSKKLDDIKDEKPSGETLEESLPFRQVILCSIRRIKVTEEKS